MSDPVTNLEIEDVLSSIRRLVSEGEPARAPVAPDAKPAVDPALKLPPLDALDAGEDAVSEPPVQATENDAPAVEKLLLTPALRVTPEEEPAPETAEATDNSIFETRASLEATIAELEAAVTARADEWEPDGSEMSITRAEVDEDLQALVEDAPTEISLAPEESQPAATPLDMTDPWDDFVASAQTEEFVETTPARDVSDVEDTADHEAETVIATSEDEDLDVEDDDLAAAAEEAILTDITNAVLDRLDTEDADAAGVPDEAEIVFDDDPAPVAFQHVPAAQPTEAAASDVAEVDMAEIRELTRQVVREELQGKLGEKITRNVRKLVRREIMRVLNAQDLD